MSLWIMWRTTSDRVVVTASGRGRPFSFAASQMHYVFSVTSSLSPLWRPAPSIAGRFGPAPPSRDRVHDHSVRVGLWAVRSAKSDHRSKRDLPRPLGRGRPFFLCGVPEPRNTPQPISASLDHRVGKRRLGGIVRLKACPMPGFRVLTSGQSFKLVIVGSFGHLLRFLKTAIFHERPSVLFEVFEQRAFDIDVCGAGHSN
jgi:hypothetical protein